ncbi:sugar ABC transporter permease [Saccharibacillus sp. CPCC 101409]|uniref:carbohydrate ABC transporter permease n=1 Tax=Saccharibacillus sp. CPCC 101409 TaxID=3058041 RepID=UPI002670F7B1|nr:sugar ABC transporter permease [Saccharibacillus sp. CPCC 101409]MDO3409999.1 sugar ABC transporter permease [Saccharibacillus sp. CPCC 101409]
MASKTLAGNTGSPGSAGGTGSAGASARSPKSSLNRQGWAAGILMVLPYTIFFALFSLIPILYGFRVSFYDWSLLGDKTFIGLQNYTNLFADEEFRSNLFNTVLFTVVSVPLITGVGLLLAVLVNGIRKGQSFLRISFFMPYVLSVSVISSIWVIFLQPYTGLLNKILRGIGLAGGEIFWLADPTLAWASIVMATLWWTIGFVFVLFLAGLQDIPESFYEAAGLEGASRWQTFRYITFPSLSRVTVLVVVLQTIASFKIFGQSKLITGGGPAGATKTVVFSIYENGFQTFQMGYASAIAFVLMLVILAVSLLQTLLLRKLGE